FLVNVLGVQKAYLIFDVVSRSPPSFAYARDDTIDFVVDWGTSLGREHAFYVVAGDPRIAVVVAGEVIYYSV
ncbi:MAG: hypothetical protein JXA89_24890, partial [Anaerolineae bacterium]|nr:hypothetical protein [Anaerolineae bacterium]